MKILLICLLSSFFISCEQKKSISHSKNIKLFEEKSFFNFKHQNNESLLRKKLLNQVVTEQIPPLLESAKIANGDEFIFIENKPTLNPREIELYNQRIKTHTKLIVSYQNQMEVYFLPAGIPFKESFQALGLKSESEYVKIIGNNSSVTLAGKTIYAIFFNEDDIVLNDQYYYEKRLNNLEEVTNKKWEILPGQKIEIILNPTLLREGQISKSFSGKSQKCTRDLMEIGGCYCTYKRTISDLILKPVAISDFSQLGVSFFIDGNGVESLSSNEMISIEGNGQYKFQFNFFENQFSKSVVFEISHKNILLSSFTSLPFDYEGSCQAATAVTELIKSQSQLAGQFIIRGRGVGLLKKLKF